MVEIGEDDQYNRIYAYPKIIKIIETSFLAITVIDRNTGNIVAFAAFDDAPCGLRGLVDDRHFGLWESWVAKATGTDEFSSFNAIWLAYFVIGSKSSTGIERQNIHHVFKQVLHTVYTSLPDLIGVLFMARGDA